MTLLDLIKKKWQIAQFVALGSLSILIATWNAVIANTTGYIILNEAMMSIMIGILTTSGLLAAVVTLIKESLK
jgi:hypothetical protein